ncbi:hypothetical protein Pfo_021849 [Paulownia fortunei]|nr:hypothetical protein Pfo_021849 [Paulownia fortunei]
MLVGEDLGFLCSVVVLVVGWFVARLKWRRVGTRREEIRRLMALASEEAARAELEAATGYSSYGFGLATEPMEEEPAIGSGLSPGRQFQYQCEVCFCPTTTRCKRCKAVHYCSGKCQIIHWRQSHKDECHSYTSHRNIDVRVHSRLKEFKEDPSKSIESSFGEHMFSNSTLHVFSGKNDTKIETSDDGKGTDINVEASVHSLPVECSSSNSLSDMSVASDGNLKDYNGFVRESSFANSESVKPLLSELPILTNLECGVTSSSMSNQLKRGCVDIDEQFESSTSSGYSAAGSEEHSLSEPPTPSSDELDDANMPNSLSCLTSSGRINDPVKVLGSDMKKAMVDDPSAVTSMPKSTDEALLSKVNENYLKSRGPLFSSCELSKYIGVSSSSAECSSKIKEANPSSLSTCHEHKVSVSEGDVPSKDVELSSLQSLAPKQSAEIDCASGIPDNLKHQEKDSTVVRASDAHLSSGACPRKHAILDVLSVENECAHRFAACPLENSGYVQNARSGTKPSARRAVDQLRGSNFIRHGSLGAGGGVMGGDEGSFSYELFVKFYNWKIVELRPCGLINCGNSCYANFVLQCLAFTPPLTTYFLQGLHSKACKLLYLALFAQIIMWTFMLIQSSAVTVISLESFKWCLTCEFEVLVKKAKEGSSPLSPACIMPQMQRMGSHLGNGTEEDAHEFLLYAIDAMQSVCLKEAGVKAPRSLDEKTTLMGLTCGGYLRSKIECMRCGGKSEQQERIMDLTVEIGGHIGTLEEACKSYEKAKKKLRVLEAPNVLTISLKRFESGKFGKLNKAVHFPEILNLAPFMSGTSDKSPIYRLYGVVDHLNVMNATFSGHYVCYIKNNDGRWFEADDSTVQAVELKKVLLKDAYMLLYARCSPRAPRLIRSSMVLREPRKAKYLTCKSKSHLAEPWNVSVGELNGQTCNDCLYLHCMSDHTSGADLEEESSIENSSSFFSEAESASTDDNFDQILGDMGNSWNRPWRNSSDSDTSPPSSSPSPLHTRRSLLADLDCYSSYAESSSSCFINVSFDVDGDGFWARTNSKVEVLRGKRRGSLLCPDSHKDCGKYVDSSSCRKNYLSRLGCNISCDNMKGVYVRRSMMERANQTFCY